MNKNTKFDKPWSGYRVILYDDGTLLKDVTACTMYLYSSPYVFREYSLLNITFCIPISLTGALHTCLEQLKFFIIALYFTILTTTAEKL